MYAYYMCSVLKKARNGHHIHWNWSRIVMVVSHYVGVGNQTWVLCKSSSQCSSLPDFRSSRYGQPGSDQDKYECSPTQIANLKHYTKFLCFFSLLRSSQVWALVDPQMSCEDKRQLFLISMLLAVCLSYVEVHSFCNLLCWQFLL